MAKLSAHGTERFRMLKVQQTPDDGLVEERSTVYAFMSDGAILKCSSVVFRANGITGRQPHSYGWTVAAKAGPKAKREFALDYQKVVEARLAERHGFKRI